MKIKITSIMERENDITPFYFHHPSTCSISGPSGSGKTWLTVNILNNIEWIYSPSPSRVVYFYSQWQDAYSDIHPQPIFIQGLPGVEDIENISEPTLFIIDDGMSKLDQSVCDIFLMYSHHRNLSIILLLQNFHNKNKHMCDINTNTNYVIFMKNPRNKLAISHLVKESFPGQHKYVMESFHDATKEPFSYLLFNFRQDTDDRLRLVSNIIPPPGSFQYVYLPIK